jgi:hypothetical protein
MIEYCDLDEIEAEDVVWKRWRMMLWSKNKIED